MARTELMHPEQQQEIDRLCEQSRLFRDGLLLPHVIAILKAEFSPLPADVFLLSATPDQLEDIYSFALGTETICKIEMPRDGGQGIITSVETFRAFRKEPHSRGSNRMLDAIEWIVRQRKSIPDVDVFGQ